MENSWLVGQAGPLVVCGRGLSGGGKRGASVPVARMATSWGLARRARKSPSVSPFAGASSSSTGARSGLAWALTTRAAAWNSRAVAGPEARSAAATSACPSAPSASASSAAKVRAVSVAQSPPASPASRCIRPQSVSAATNSWRPIQPFPSTSSAACSCAASLALSASPSAPAYRSTSSALTASSAFSSSASHSACSRCGSSLPPPPAAKYGSPAYSIRDSSSPASANNNALYSRSWVTNSRTRSADQPARVMLVDPWRRSARSAEAEAAAAAAEAQSPCPVVASHCDSSASRALGRSAGSRLRSARTHALASSLIPAHSSPSKASGAARMAAKTEPASTALASPPKGRRPPLRSSNAVTPADHTSHARP
mmetsp:Transcript_6694/g.22278  ORF Transcript_6694/g.22278 Transcript_6694/m.22278 type:complete len:370 (-) Transcript_6694:634-1743(-)